MGASLQRSRDELATLADEQAALRRVATLVARGAPPDTVFSAVAEEVGRLLGADRSVVGRYDRAGAATVVGTWSTSDAVTPIPVGHQWERGGRNLHTLVFEAARPARIDDHADATGAGGDAARGWGFRSAVGAPINVEGQLWGFMTAASTHEETPPADTEARLARFAELVATAIANAQARLELRGYAEEQAALRRVATLVARATPPGDVFAAVTAETAQLLSADNATMSRYDEGGGATVVGAWFVPGTRPVPVGLRMEAGGHNLHTRVFETGGPARMDHYDDASGAAGGVARRWGIRSSVGAPISVEGRLWGVIGVGSREEPLPADTEARLSGFTELVATAISNAEAQAALTASRARIMTASDTTRRRIERELHDAAQQRLVSLALHLRGTVQAAVPPGADELTAQLAKVADDIVSVVDGLRELARGVHPVALAQGGLRPALRTLARRSAVPVRLHLDIEGRLPEPIELAAYYVVAEALTNAVKHAHATGIDVQATSGDGALRVAIRDDGRGGADPTDGSGLVGLTDRVEALGGRLTLTSPPGAGTAMQVVLPLTAPPEPQPEPGPARGG
jgi:signal transduction histidine kinase